MGYSDEEVLKQFGGGMSDEEVLGQYGAAPPVGGIRQPKEQGGFVASAKQAVGATVKGAGQLAADIGIGGQDNALKQYGQSVIDANPTAVKGFGDIVDKPLTTVTEATGNAAGSLGTMLGIRAVGQGITAAAPLTGPAAPFVAGAGQLISWAGPAAVAALPSFGGIREKQIEKDPEATSSWTDKAVAALGAGTVGLIETKFGPQDWALKLTTEAGRKQLSGMLASETIKGAIGKGAVKGALVEGGEELVQNPVEQLASGDNLLTPESLEETAFGGVMGAVGGGVLGGGLGPAMRTKKDETPKGDEQVAPAAEVDPVMNTVQKETLNQATPDEVKIDKVEGTTATVTVGDKTVELPVEEAAKAVATGKLEEVLAEKEAVPPVEELPTQPGSPTTTFLRQNGEARGFLPPVGKTIEQVRAETAEMSPREKLNYFKENKATNYRYSQLDRVEEPAAQQEDPSITNDILYDLFDQQQAAQDMADTQKRRVAFERLRSGGQTATEPILGDTQNASAQAEVPPAGQSAETARPINDEFAIPDQAVLPNGSVEGSQAAASIPPSPAGSIPSPMQEGVQLPDGDGAVTLNSAQGLTNPLRTTSAEVPKFKTKEEVAAYKASLREQGYDGVYLTDKQQSFPFDVPKAAGATPASVVAEVKGFLGRGYDNLARKGKVEVVQSLDDAKATGIPLRGASGKVAGVYNPKLKKIVLIADNIEKGDGEFVFLHEGGHALLREDPAFIKQKDKIIADFMRMAKDSETIRAAIARVPRDTRAEVRDEEALMHWLQDKRNHKHSLYKRIISAVKAALYRLGLAHGKLSESDLVALFSQGTRAWANRKQDQDLTSGRTLGEILNEFAQDPLLSVKEAGRKIQGLAAFKKWFGDSKVVDSEGNPLVVYHGSNKSKLRRFDKTKIGTGVTGARNAAGFYFSSSRDAAAYFADPVEQKDGTIDERVYEVYLKLQNPKVVNSMADLRQAEKDAQYEGYDGIIAKSIFDGGEYSDVYVVFEPTQIKSIFNQGTWDGKNPDILFSKVSDQSGVASSATAFGDPDPVESGNVQRGVEGKSIIEAAQFLVSNGPGAAYKLVAKKTLETLQRLEKSGVVFSLSVIHLGEQVPVSMLSVRGTTSTDFSNGVKVDVRLNGDDVTGKKGTSYVTALHELIHAATQAAVHLGNTRVNADTATGKATADLIKISNRIIRHFNARVNTGAALTEFEQRALSRGVNALNDQHEILAWALTSREMQDYLESIPADKTDSMWSKFVKSIRTFLGLDAANDSALSEILRVGEELLLSGDPMQMLQNINGATKSQTTAFEVSNAMVNRPEQLFSKVSNNLQAGNQEIKKASTILQDIKNPLHDLYIRFAPQWLSVMPISHLAQTFGKSIQWLKDIDKHNGQMEAIKAQLPDDFYAIYQDAERIAEKNSGLKAFNNLLLTGTFNQMTPWASIDEQGWVPESHPAAPSTEMRLKEAEKLWKSEGMAKSTGKTFRQAYAETRAAWDKLKPAEQEQAKKVVAYLSSIRERERNNLLATIEAVSQEDPDLRKQLMDQFNATFSNIRGIYVPLSRYGTYTLKFTLPDGREQVDFFKTPGERRAFRKQMIDSGVDSNTMIEDVKRESIKGEAVIPQALREQLMKAMEAKYLTGVNLEDGQAVSEARGRAMSAISDLDQVLLRWMPETSALKNSIHRNNVLGASTDMLRSSMDYVLRHAGSIAWMEVGRKIEQDIQNFEEENKELAKDTEGPVNFDMRTHLLNNVRRWNQAVRNESVGPIASTLGKFSTAYFMTSPSTFLVQLTQLPVLTLPAMAVKYKSWAKATAALTEGLQKAFNKKYSKDAMYGDEKVNEVYAALHRRVTEKDRTGYQQIGQDWFTPAEKLAKIAGLKTNYQRELLALREALAMNMLDISAVHEASDIAQGKQTTYFGKAMRYAMLPMQHGELGSRKATVLANFKLATEQKKDFFAALDDAAVVVGGTLYNYAKSDKGWFLQGGLARTVTTFQTYRIKTALRMGILLMQSLKGETPDVKKAALKEFIGVTSMSAALAGVHGTVIGGLIFGLANLFGGDDDEPYDAELEFNKWLEESFGATAAGAAAYGLPTLLGTNLSKRIGMGDLYGTQSEPPANLHGAALAAWWAGNAIGPSFSVAQSWVKGYDQMSNKGNYLRGLEEALPKPLKDGLKAIRVATEGVKTGAGKKLIEDAQIDQHSILMLALGLNPDEIAKAQGAERTLNKMGTALTERRGRLIKDAAQAIVESEDTTDAMEAIRTFNSKLPLFAVSGKDIKPAVRKLVLGELGTTGVQQRKVASQFGITTYSGE